MRHSEGFHSFWNRDRESRTEAASLIAVGDILLSRGIAERISEHGLSYPFEMIGPALSQDGVIFGNLENPISSRGTPSPLAQTNFRANPSAVEGLVSAGFNVLSLANNHICDYGDEAIEDTIGLLKSKGIVPIGVGESLEEACRPAILSAGDVRVALLAYASARNFGGSGAYVMAPIELERLRGDISKAKGEADICIVSLHFGYEEIEYPPPECRKQAMKAVEYGADLVIGHHPHVLQGLERYRGGVIVYSLGNFVFDNLTPMKRESAILRVTFDREGIGSIELLPVWINDCYQPEIASEDLADGIIARIDRLSGYLGDGTNDRRFWESAGGRFLSDQREGISKSVRRYGLKTLLFRLRRLRPFHLRLLVAVILNKFKRGYTV